MRKRRPKKRRANRAPPPPALQNLGSGLSGIDVGLPDFDLSVASDRFVLLLGEPLEIPITVARRDGFDSEAEIQLLADGLPPDVVAEAKITEQEKGPPQLSLVLTAQRTFPGALQTARLDRVIKSLYGSCFSR